MGGRHNNATTDTQLAGIQIQTSLYGSCLPLVYGTTRITGNLVYAPASGFVATPHTTTQSTGKGGSSNSSSTTYTYTAFVVIALCEGPIASINQVWSTGALGSLSGYGFTFTALGTRPQTPWATLTSNYPAQAVPYSGMACVASASLPLASGASVPNFGFEVVAFFATQQDPLATSAYDALPSDIITDFLTNAYYGAGWTTAQLDLAGMTTGSASYATYCKACGFVLSPSFDTQKDAGEHLQDILDATNSEIISHSTATGMVLQVLPYGDVAITANGATYIPNTTPIYSLGYDDFITNGPSDPVTITRDSTQDVKNCVPVEYLDRTLAYNTNVSQMPDPVDVALNGQKNDSAKTLHCICRASVAQQISLILSQKNVYIRNGYGFNLGLKYMLLESMDLVAISDPIIGFAAKVIRIVSIDIPGEDSEQEGLTFTCEEWPFGVANAALYTTQTPAGVAPNVNVDPGSAATPLIFTSPALYSQTGGPEVCVLTAGGANWGTADVYASAAGASYGKVGSITAPARYGTLTASLAAWAGGLTQDNTNTLSVVLPNGGTLASIDATSAANGLNLLWVDGEMISFQTATLTSANHYNLTGLYRGLYGTTPGLHASGASWGRMDGAVFHYPIVANQVGVLAYLKLLSYNLWAGGGRTLSGETPYSFTPAAQTFPAPTGVTISVTSTAMGGSHIFHPTAGDYTDGVDGNGGSPQVVTKQWLNVSWSWAANNPVPDHFEVVIYTGTDPTNTSAYLYPILSVPNTVNTVQQAFTTNTALATINASVRAVYV